MPDKDLLIYHPLDFRVDNGRFIEVFQELNRSRLVILIRRGIDDHLMISYIAAWLRSPQDRKTMKEKGEIT